MEMLALNNSMYINNNDILFDIVNKLEDIIKDINNDIIINRIRDIIILMNNLIKDNKKNIELIRKDIEELSNKMMNNFKELKNNNNGNIMNYEYKKHIIIMIDMKDNLEMVKDMEKEYIILIMVIDLRIF